MSDSSASPVNLPYFSELLSLGGFGGAERDANGRRWSDAAALVEELSKQRESIAKIDMKNI
jgi:hypothetical protein